ncbi:DUF5667 domain-containing protein [Chloroflexota bacterium]
MSKEFDNILDECLERLLVKGETIEQCLQSYPEQAVNLKPLLETALATRKAVAVQPPDEFKARARYQFHSALQEAASRRRYSFLGWLPRWATVVAIVLGVLMMGGGTIAAAGYSMPDSLLYPVKLATEQVQLALTPSDNGKAKLNAEYADRRVTEIIYTASKGDAKKIEAATQRLDKGLTMLARLTSTPEVAEAPRMMESSTPPMLTEEAESRQEIHGDKNNRGKLRATVANYAINHPAGLRAALEKAPESAKPALRRAIAVSEAGYDKALKGWD